MIKFSDLSELKKEEIPIKNVSDTLKYLSKYYGKDDFNEQLLKLPFVNTDRNEFSWAFE